MISEIPLRQGFFLENNVSLHKAVCNIDKDTDSNLEEVILREQLQQRDFPNKEGKTLYDWRLYILKKKIIYLC